MKNFQMVIILVFLIIGIVAVSACVGNDSSTTKTSIVGKKTDLNIGDSAVLTSNGDSISIKVVNYSQPSTTTGNTGNFFNPGQTNAATTTTAFGYGSSFYAIRYEVKNVGDKALIYDPDKIWVTDWAKVNIDTALRDTVCSDKYRCISNSRPLYPGDSITRVKYYHFSDKSLEGKLTFYYQFGDDTASWIIKP